MPRETFGVQLGYASSSVMVERDALTALAAAFTGRRLPVARSIYLALVELALAGRVDATRAMVADYAGVTRKALDDYVPEMEATGLVQRERRVDGDGRNLPNVWTILRGRGTEGASGGSSAGEGHPGHPPHPSPTPSEEEKKTDGEGRRGAPSVSFHADVPEELRADALGLLRQKRRVDGRVVVAEEIAVAVAALAEFNRQAGAEHGLGANLTPLVMRVRERPAYDADAHVRLVQSAWRVKWWERQRGGSKRRPTPAVIYGNERVFEAVVQDAVDEKAGKTPQVDVEKRGRFTREG